MYLVDVVKNCIHQSVLELCVVKYALCLKSHTSSHLHSTCRVGYYRASTFQAEDVNELGFCDKLSNLLT